MERASTDAAFLDRLKPQKLERSASTMLRNATIKLTGTIRRKIFKETPANLEPVEKPVELKRTNTLKSLTQKISKPLEAAVKSSSDALNRSVSIMRGNTIRKENPFKPVSPPTKLWQETLEDVSILNNLTKQEIKRQELIFELVETEKQYIADLKLIIEEYVKPIKEMQILDSVEQDTLFSNIQTLYKLNQMFLKALIMRQAEEEIVENIGDIIIDRFEQFEEYGTYCENQYAAKLLYNSKMSEATVFQEFVKSNSNRSRRLDVWSFLDAPRRRIAKYPLLVKSILESTPSEHPDYDSMKKAYQVVNRVVSELSSEDRVSELPSFSKLSNIPRNTSVQSLAASIASVCTISPQNAQKLLQLQQCVRESNHKELVQAIMKSKEVYYEGIIIDMKKNRVILAILVDQGLLLLKRDRDAKLGAELNPSQFKRLYIKPLALSNVNITELPPMMATQDINIAKTAIVIQDMSKKPVSYYFQLQSIEQKQELIQAFQRAKSK